MKILIAVDGSACSTKAVKRVVKLFTWFHAVPELHLLHVKLSLQSGAARAVLGKDMVNKLMTGSVATKVFAFTDVPVLIVR